MQSNFLNDIVNNNMLQHAFVMRDDLIAVVPKPQQPIDDGHDAEAALVLIGFLAGEPVYRTTHTAAHYMEERGVFRIHWPPLFPNVWIPACDHMQLDVTIRNQFSPGIPTVESENDGDDGQNMMFFDDTADETHAYDDDNIYAWDNYQQQQPTEPSYDYVNDGDSEWIIVDDVNDEWVM